MDSPKKGAVRIRYDLSRGLSEEAAAISRETFGTNVLTKKKQDGFLIQFFRNFNDPIIKILIGALCINIAVTLGHVNWLECGGIAAAILIATLVSTVSEYSSAQAFEHLSSEAEDTLLSVRRNGVWQSVRISEIAVGDIIHLVSGDGVPADGMLVSGSVSVDQSPLSGESEEKKKCPWQTHPSTVGEVVPQEILWDTENPCQLFRGSRVTDGEADFLVLRVGDATLYGGAFADIQESARPSPLKARLAELAKNVSFLGYIAAGAIAFAYLFNVFVIDSGMNPTLIREKITDLSFALPALIRALTVAISVLVVAVPEGLPMMITVVLSSNMKKMLAAGVLVRRMVGIETAGNLNILFTDKTGTLTEGKLRIASVVSAQGEADSASTLKKSPALYAALADAHAACMPEGRGNATDRAMQSFFGTNKARLGAVVARVPFSSERRYCSGTITADGQIKTYVRGAPEVILPAVRTYLAADGRICPLTPAVHAKIQARWHTFASASFRVIAVAQYNGEAKKETADFENLTFIALIAIRDRLRADAKKSVEVARAAGIQTVMITGDNPLTAEAIAKECGILTGTSPSLVLTGAQLAEMTDEEVCARLPEIAVVARALPTDKSRLVRLSQSLGLVVGMTGDGINDTPALRTADVGFSMGSGTNAARQASDIVITDDRFSSITRAVLYGRTIFLSIRKFIVFQLTMNLCALGVSLIGPFIGIENPVTVIQMLWVNIIMDTLGALAFAGEPALNEYMRRPPRKRSEQLLSREMIRNILTTGGYTLALCLWFLKSPLMHRVFFRGDEVYYLTVFFSLFIFCGIFNCFNARTERLSILSHLSGNKPFIFIMILVAAVQLLIVYFGGEMFRCVPLTAREITLSALLASTVITADFLRRMLGRTRRRK